jgi:ABC-type multidrug transport system fused ATPase/permease subunit
LARDAAGKRGVAVVFYFLGQYKRQVLLVAFLSILAGGLEAATVAAVYPLLVFAVDQPGGGSSTILAIYGALASLVPVDDTFIAHAVVFMITALVAFLSRILLILYRTAFSARVVQERQQHIFEQYMNADYRFFTSQRQGDLIYNVGRAPLALSDLIVSVTGLISEGMLSLSILVFLFSLSWPVTLVVIMLAVVYLFLSRLVGRKVSYHAARQELDAIKDFNVILNEVFTGILYVKAFDAIRHWSRAFASTISRRWRYFTLRARAIELPSPSLLLVIYASIGAAALVTRILYPIDFIEWIPVFGAFAFALFRLVPVEAKASSLLINVMATLPDCELYYDVIHERIHEVRDGTIPLPSLGSRIEFVGVSFAYPNGKKALTDVSIRFERGKTTAIVGASGSGKTTVLNLLLRLYDVTSGAIRIDGRDIRDYQRGTFISKIGYVSQEAFALNDTVRANISFGREFSDEEVVQASKHANAHDFVSALPRGYDTVVGDRGVTLSSGQRQRIALARAIVGRPELFVFDEATNALDSLSEAAVQEAMKGLSESHTVIVVAHRLSTIVHADRIVVLEAGAVVEEGSHRDLIARRGAYWRLYESQAVERERVGVAPVARE